MKNGERLQRLTIITEGAAVLFRSADRCDIIGADVAGWIAMFRTNLDPIANGADHGELSSLADLCDNFRGARRCLVDRRRARTLIRSGFNTAASAQRTGRSCGSRLLDGPRYWSGRAAVPKRRECLDLTVCVRQFFLHRSQVVAALLQFGLEILDLAPGSLMLLP